MNKKWYCSSELDAACYGVGLETFTEWDKTHCNVNEGIMCNQLEHFVTERVIWRWFVEPVGRQNSTSIPD